MQENKFEKIKKIDSNGSEYWSSRDLSKELEYSDYRKFLNVIEKAKIACQNSDEVIHNHFVHVDEMVQIGSGAERSIDTMFLSRYYGYKGLYGGLTMDNIHSKKGLLKPQKILDHMNSEELAANLFRATQTEAKIKRDNIKGQGNANLAHYEVGQKVRNTISALGGTMPENLPVTDSIGKAKTRIKKTEKKVLSQNKKDVKGLTGKK